MSRNVLVIGMPRSGTSLTAAVFARKGYYVGRSRLSALQHGDDHNPFGYFEADAVVERNVALLRRIGYTFQNTWQFEPLPDAARRALWTLPPSDEDRRLVRAYDEHAPWLWKDQRLCFTLPYWWPLLDPSRVGVLLIRRKVQDIHRSFQRMGWCSGERADEARVQQLIDQHLGAAEEAIGRLAIPAIEIEYGEYTRAPEAVAERIGRFFELDLAASDLNVHPELDHSSRRGRLAANLRILLKRLPRPAVRRMERMVPGWLIARVFSERRYAPSLPPEAVVTTRTLALGDVSGEAERAVAARLGRDPLEVAIAARRTWGRSLSSELASRVDGAGASRAPAAGRTGREQLVTALVEELTTRLDDGAERSAATSNEVGW